MGINICASHKLHWLWLSNITPSDESVKAFVGYILYNIKEVKLGFKTHLRYVVVWGF